MRSSWCTLGYKTISLFSKDNITDSSTNHSLDNESIYSQDTITNSLSQQSQVTDRIDEIIGLLKAEGPNLYHLTDEAFKDRILTILYGLC